MFLYEKPFYYMVQWLEVSVYLMLLLGATAVKGDYVFLLQAVCQKPEPTN